MSDKNTTGMTATQELAHGFKILKRCFQVQTARRFIEAEVLGLVYQGAAQQKTALLPGGHGGIGFVPEVMNSQVAQRFSDTCPLFAAERLVPVGPDGGIETGQDDILARHITKVLVLKIV